MLLCQIYDYHEKASNLSFSLVKNIFFSLFKEEIKSPTLIFLTYEKKKKGLKSDSFTSLLRLKKKKTTFFKLLHSTFYFLQLEISAAEA